ncbi:hypothetical protein CTAYLR_005038 [Chrysophaeum taylorii]|uniref:RRM domain-containing protein n=1 Tax=Chrysophaeum taylorii TaxID=2483200 RepID=A0AAD7XKF4_9STRA|nr:hypothetical protein CTAYLR_005038 [Chrysophaeum taylorii]
MKRDVGGNPRGGGHGRNDVFVGNIAFGTSEEDLKRIFSEVGRVVAVRLATHAESGKSRGYCFVEYEDAATALSAIRNLNNREINGRPLRVNFSNNSNLVDYAQSVGDSGPATKPERTAQSVVESMSKREVWEVVKDAKDVADADRARLRRLLEENSALVDGLVHAMLVLGMIKEPPPEARPLEPAPAPSRFTPPPRPYTHPPQQFAPRSGAPPPRGGVPGPPHFSQPQPARPPPAYADPRGPPRGFYQPGPSQQQPQVPPPELVKEALALSPQQLAQLPPDRRAKIEMLRDKFSRGEFVSEENFSSVFFLLLCGHTPPSCAAPPYGGGGGGGGMPPQQQPPRPGPPTRPPRGIDLL